MIDMKEIKVSECNPFRDNPFKIKDDFDMEMLIQSIKDNGVLVPIVVRPQAEIGYEIISGHRRIHACKKAGIETVPAFVRQLSRDDAVIMLVDTNLQRESLLPSEKAFAYKMKLEAISHQGRTSPQLAEKLSIDRVGDSEGVSGDTIWRYVRVTRLCPELLQLVDDGKIALSPAVALSYLTEKEQADLVETIASEDCTPSYAQAIRMKKMSQAGRLSMDDVFTIMTEVKGNQQEYLKLPVQKYERYLKRYHTPQQKEDFILKAMDYYSRYLEKQRNRDSR